MAYSAVMHPRTHASLSAFTPYAQNQIHLWACAVRLGKHSRQTRLRSPFPMLFIYLHLWLHGEWSLTCQRALTLDLSPHVFVFLEFSLSGRCMIILARRVTVIHESRTVTAAHGTLRLYKPRFLLLPRLSFFSISYKGLFSLLSMPISNV